MGYSKLDGGIIHSTLWSEPHDVRVTWITLLAVTDATGYVRMAIPALAKLVGISIERTEEILDILHSPDKYSRTKEHDGRRLETVDGGWVILNYPKYREGLKNPDPNLYERQKRYRQKQAQKLKVLEAQVGNKPCVVPTVVLRSDNPQAEAEAEAYAEEIQECTTYTCAEPEAVSTRQPVSEPVMRFPIIGVKGEMFGLSQAKLDEWQETYGASLNVPHELRTARQWLLDNPGRRKTERGMTKFLGGWLERAQNRRGGKHEKVSIPGMSVGEFGENE